MGSVRLYFHYLSVSLRSQLEYRGSLLMLAVGTFMLSVIEFLGLWALFARFGTLRGWTLPEVMLLYGMVEVTFAVADAFFRGLDAFPGLVKRGDFDRLLLRPRSTILQLLGQEVALRRLGRASQGLVVLVWAAASLGVVWTPAKLLLLLAAIAGGMCLYCGLMIFFATLVIWTIEPLEITNALSDGSVAQYPLDIYGRWFRRFLTFVVPLACVNYLPGLALMDKASPLGTPVLAQWLSPLGGLVFLLVSLRVWRFGLRHYMSTGS
jgi:ABC-2 type transport system permease protein